ncbi:ISAs1 family transposase [Rhodoplanes serenus]|uniref:ISAs1 family transposase n=1 Tax=Rhodoplanes serenus TaxID=200615 RepID=A0A9X4XR79_9BRAD|nr:ISAs1 family transposase [Rhodoplanes serenus]
MVRNLSLRRDLRAVSWSQHSPPAQSSSSPPLRDARARRRHPVRAESALGRPRPSDRRDPARPTPERSRYAASPGALWAGRPGRLARRRPDRARRRARGRTWRRRGLQRLDYKQSTYHSPITEKRVDHCPGSSSGLSAGTALGSAQSCDCSSVSYGFFEGLPPHQGGRHGGVHHVIRASSGSPGRNARHDLVELLFIAFVAVLCGAKTFFEMAEFGRSKTPFFKNVLGLAHGVPSHDTFSAVFRMLAPKAFGATLAPPSERCEVVVIDRKAVKHVYEAGKAHAPKMMVSAFAAELRMTLSCLAHHAGSEGAEERDLAVPAVALAGAQPGRERLAAPARQLALQPRIRHLRRHRRRRLRRLATPRRPARDHHVHQNASMG